MRALLDVHVLVALPPNPRLTASVAQRLGRAVADASHVLWPDAFSLLDPGRLLRDRVLSSRRITDAYLLARAAASAGRLVTFDRGIGVEAVRGASKKSLLGLA